MNDAADALTIVTGVIAVGLAVASMSGPARWMAAWRLSLSKMRTVGRELRGGPLSPGARRRSWITVWRATSAQVKRRVNGEQLEVADELAWLTRTLERDHAVTFVADSELDALNQLAQAYRTLSARLTVRVLLGNQAFTEAEAATARATGHRLATMARRQPEPVATADSDAPDSRAHGSSDASVPPAAWRGPSGGPLQAGEIALFGIGPGARNDVHGLAVSSRRMRLVPDDEAAFRRARAEGSQPVAVHVPDEAPVTDPLEGAHLYDGTLPSLLGLRFERDSRNGSHRVHLSLGEISYRAHKIVSTWPPSSDHSTPTLLTLSLTPLTADGHLVLVRRAAASPFYPECWAPGVNGNLEMPDPLSRWGDADEDGLPDPIAALCREGEEELGLAIDRRTVHLHGVARISNETERGTWVLLTTARLPQTLDDLVAQTSNADPLEGRWESGSALLAVPRPRTARAASELLTWAWSNHDVMPHTTAALTAYCAVEGLVGDDDWSDWRRDVAVDLPPDAQLRRFG